jgi:hypothetical protein
MKKLMLVLVLTLVSINTYAAAEWREIMYNGQTGYGYMSYGKWKATEVKIARIYPDMTDKLCRYFSIEGIGISEAMYLIETIDKSLPGESSYDQIFEEEATERCGASLGRTQTTRCHITVDVNDGVINRISIVATVSRTKNAAGETADYFSADWDYMHLKAAYIAMYEPEVYRAAGTSQQKAISFLDKIGIRVSDNMEPTELDHVLRDELPRFGISYVPKKNKGEVLK